MWLLNCWRQWRTAVVQRAESWRPSGVLAGAEWFYINDQSWSQDHSGCSDQHQQLWPAQSLKTAAEALLLHRSWAAHPSCQVAAIIHSKKLHYISTSCIETLPHRWDFLSMIYFTYVLPLKILELLIWFGWLKSICGQDIQGLNQNTMGMNIIGQLSRMMRDDFHIACNLRHSANVPGLKMPRRPFPSAETTRDNTIFLCSVKALVCSLQNPSLGFLWGLWFPRLKVDKFTFFFFLCFFQKVR